MFLVTMASSLALGFPLFPRVPVRIYQSTISRHNPYFTHSNFLIVQVSIMDSSNFLISAALRDSSIQFSMRFICKTYCLILCKLR